jgi:hypothetical protein
MGRTRKGKVSKRILNEPIGTESAAEEIYVVEKILDKRFAALMDSWKIII